MSNYKEDQDFSLWAFGLKESTSMKFYELVRSWNKLHSNLFKFPETWNKENEDCFSQSLKVIYERYLKYKIDKIEDSSFQENTR